MSIYRNVSVIQGKDEIRLGRYPFIDGGGRDFLGYGPLVTGCLGYGGIPKFRAEQTGRVLMQ